MWMYLPFLHLSCCQGQFYCRCAVLALPPYSLAQTVVYSKEKQVNTKTTKSSILTSAFIVGLKVFENVFMLDVKLQWIQFCISVRLLSAFCKCVVFTTQMHQQQKIRFWYISDSDLFHPIPILLKLCDQARFTITWSVWWQPCFWSSLNHT